MTNKTFFLNSNIFLDSDIEFNTLEDILMPLGGNTGNSYITYSLMKQIRCNNENIEHIPSIHNYNFLNQDKDIDIINNECDQVIFVMQDQIRTQESYEFKLPYNHIMNFIKKINKPIIIAGLGANSIHGYNKHFYENLDPELITFLKFLSDHCIEIGVRGNYTKEILNKFHINNVRPIGCPTFFERGKNRIIQKKNKNLNNILYTSNNFFNSTINPKHVICQDLCETELLNAVIFNKWNPNSDYYLLNKWKNKQYHLFTNIEEWKKFITSFDFAIGCRLHGTIIALNSNIPAICCKNDYRTKEMCEFLHIPYYWQISKNTNIKKLYKNLDLTDLNSNYNDLFNNYNEFLIKNNIKKYSEFYIEQPNININQSKFQIELKKHLKTKKINFIEKIFSIKKNSTHRIIMLLGFRMRFRIK